MRIGKARLPSGRNIRLFIAAPAPCIRSALRCAAGQFDAVDVVGEATDSAELCSAAGQTRPDILLLDLSLPHGEVKCVMADLKTRHPGLQIIALDYNSESGSAWCKAGADYIIPACSPPPKLMRALEQAIARCRRAET